MANFISDELKIKIGQLFMVGISGEVLSDKERNFIDSYGIGFVILFSRNISSPVQLKGLTDSIHQLGDVPPLIFIDQEGGPIVRLGEMGSTLISHMGIAATGKEKNAKKAGRIIGEELRTLGIDGVFAPVLDVNTTGENPVIGIRAFSDDPLIVSRFGVAFFKGLKREGIIACGKHFPGHGHTKEDSHLQIPNSTIDNSFFTEKNILPFKVLIDNGIDTLMTAHVLFPEISEEIATFSPRITNDILREELGFSGVLFSDCLEMDAVKKNFSSERIIEKIVNSSVDVISVSHSIDLQKEMIELLRDKIGEDDKCRDKADESLQRIKKLKKSIKSVKNKRVPTLRKNKKTEKRIAIESVTVLKNEFNIVPLRERGTLFIVDMKKKIHTANNSDEDTKSEIKRVSEHFFLKVKYVRIGKEENFVNRYSAEIKGFDTVLLVNNSMSEKINEKELLLTKQILKLRKDLILIFAQSPYPAKYFENAGTIVLTYGSRRVQVEALFSILSGRSKSKGKLPVSISQQFPIGSFA